MTTDEKGILRVGGRLIHAPIPYQAKRPAILPKKHDIVPLILLHLRESLNPSGIEHILAYLRQRYWIPKVRSALKKIAKTCHVCRKHNAKPDPLLMASLLQSRLQAFTPPFYNTGVDYFGPLLGQGGKNLSIFILSCSDLSEMRQCRMQECPGYHDGKLCSASFFKRTPHYSSLNFTVEDQ